MMRSTNLLTYLLIDVNFFSVLYDVCSTDWLLSV